MTHTKIVLITGANSGTGKATAIEMAKSGHTVVMLCRDKTRGEAAFREVVELSGSSQVDLMLCDLASIDEIKRFTIDFKNKYNRLHILINNAGVILPGRHETKDGYELQFGVNHLGHFFLTRLLLELIVKSAPSRIINVASGAHKIGKIHFEDINLIKNYTVWKAYAQSKLANIIFTYELSRRLYGSGVTVNCLHPGAVATNMGINRETNFGTLITRALKPFFQTPIKGAETILYLAKSADVEGVTGKYFYKKRFIKSSKVSYDSELAKQLWGLSERMIKDKGGQFE
jgi:NAD(P)-dependent dehydrogenase (short-subunit alcohol dehydrogenase family)